MLIALNLIAALAAAGQDAPAAASADGERRVESHVIMVPGGPGGRGSLDKDNDGFVSADEFNAPLAGAFGRMDKDGDGRLSTEELSSSHGEDGHRVVMMGGPGGHGGPGLRDIEIIRHGVEGMPHGPGPHRIEVRRLGGEAGERGDGDVMMFRSERGEGGHRIILPHGRGHDGDGDRRVFVHRFDGAGGHGAMDKDGDGKVSEEEFIAPLREAFREMDADRSGSLEAGEHGPNRD
jgi:hypothetical protein